MPHFPKPFFRKNRGLWYVQLDGKQVNLGPDRDEAFARYHKLMQAPVVASATATDLVAVVIDAFLDWCSKHRAQLTYKRYREWLNRRSGRS